MMTIRCQADSNARAKLIMAVPAYSKHFAKSQVRFSLCISMKLCCIGSSQLISWTPQLRPLRFSGER